MELNNYRPISVLNIFSKIFERLMYNKLIKFLDKYNILDQNQFRFRQGHSTNTSYIDMALYLYTESLIMARMWADVINNIKYTEADDCKL